MCNEKNVYRAVVSGRNTLPLHSYFRRAALFRQIELTAKDEYLPAKIFHITTQG